jgi:hypothetical protein
MNTILISYIPLITGDPMGSLEVDKDNFAERAMELVNNSPSGQAAGCVWILDHNVPCPIFIYEDQAQERQEHLLHWTENQPEKWFSFAHRVTEHGYGVVLMPDIEKSAQRHSYINKGKLTYTNVIFSPPHMVSQNTCTISHFEIPKDKIKVGFMNMERAHPEKYHPDFVFWIGELPVKQSEMSESYLDDIMNGIDE